MKILPVEPGEKKFGLSVKKRTEYGPKDGVLTIDSNQKIVDLTSHPNFGSVNLMVESEDIFLLDGVTPKPVSQQKVVVLEF